MSFLRAIVLGYGILHKCFGFPSRPRYSKIVFLSNTFRSNGGSRQAMIRVPLLFNSEKLFVVCFSHFLRDRGTLPNLFPASSQRRTSYRLSRLTGV